MKKWIVGIFACIVYLRMLAFAAGDAYCPIEEGLCIERMLRLEENVSVNRIYYDSQGEEYFSSFLYADLDEGGSLRIVYEDSDGNVEILSDGMSVGFDAWSAEMYRLVFLMDEYENNIGMMKEGFFCDVLLNEKILSDRIAEGKRTVITHTPVNADESLSGKRMEYVFDAETDMLLKVTDSFVYPDGTVEMLSQAFVSFGEGYAFPAQLLETAGSPGDQKIIVYPEGEDEEPTEISAPRNVRVTFVHPEELILFEDQARTRMYAGQQMDESGLYPEYTEIYIGSFE